MKSSAKAATIPAKQVQQGEGVEMKRGMRWAVGFMVVALCAPMAQAGKIYKCVKDGRVTYSSLRCADGTGVAITRSVQPVKPDSRPEESERLQNEQAERQKRDAAEAARAKDMAERAAIAKRVRCAAARRDLADAQVSNALVQSIRAVPAMQSMVEMERMLMEAECD
jgi:gas vesicle protein